MLNRIFASIIIFVMTVIVTIISAPAIIYGLMMGRGDEFNVLYGEFARRIHEIVEDPERL